MLYLIDAGDGRIRYCAHNSDRASMDGVAVDTSSGAAILLSCGERVWVTGVAAWPTEQKNRPIHGYGQLLPGPHGLELNRWPPVKRDR